MLTETQWLQAAVGQFGAMRVTPPPFIDRRVLVVDHRQHADGERTRCAVAPILFFSRDRRRKPRNFQRAICGSCRRFLFWIYVCHGRIEAVPGTWNWRQIKAWARCGERRR